MIIFTSDIKLENTKHKPKEQNCQIKRCVSDANSFEVLTDLELECSFYFYCKNQSVRHSKF